MTPEEHERRFVAWCDDLAEAALGRLYWSEAQLLTSDVNAILVGDAGHLKMLQSIFGGGPKLGGGRPERDTAFPKLTPKAFDAMFGAPLSRRKN